LRTQSLSTAHRSDTLDRFGRLSDSVDQIVIGLRIEQFADAIAKKLDS
jgi:hypothetical protein